MIMQFGATLRMATTAMNAVGVTSIVILSLYLWRYFYPETDFAAFFLLPLSVLVFIGSLWAGSAVYQASMKAAVRGDSPFAWLLTGRLRAILGASLFIIVAAPLLAWHAISSTLPEFILFGILCFVASMLFAGIEKRSLQHLTPAFARTTALTAATLVACAIFIPVFAWANWNFTLQPGAIRSASLEQALQLGFDQLPARRGWVAEIMAPLYALEYAKLWFVVQAGSPKWFSFWYSIDAALISVIAARVSTVLMSIVHGKRGDFNEPKPTH
jgi:hypothetical protein